MVDVTSRLPELLDRKRLACEIGVGRATVDAIFRALPVISLPGHRKVFVRRKDVYELLEANTFRNQSVRSTWNAS